MTKKASAEVVHGKIAGVKARIVWETPDSITTRWVSNMLVQNLENDFKISFFELKPELYFGGTPPTEAKAVCVSSIVVSAQRLAKFIEVLQQQLDKKASNIKNEIEGS